LLISSNSRAKKVKYYESFGKSKFESSDEEISSSSDDFPVATTPKQRKDYQKLFEKMKEAERKLKNKRR
jgi:hypothetical protein